MVAGHLSMTWISLPGLNPALTKMGDVMVTVSQRVTWKPPSLQLLLKFRLQLLQFASLLPKPACSKWLQLSPSSEATIVFH